MGTIDAPITPTRSSNEDIEAGIVRSQEQQTKPGIISVKKEDLPEYQDAIPPPPYTAAETPASQEEQPWGIRDWFNRHRTLTGWLLGILSLGILAGLLLGITVAAILNRCGSDCGGTGDGRQYTSDMCPVSREDLLRDAPSSSTPELPKPTGFADGDPNRLLYTNVGGIEPNIGSSFTAISSHLTGERIFYHDARGQIYESFYGPKASGYYQRDREWGVFKVPEAIMAVNTSLAAVSIDTGYGLEDYHNTTVLYYHPANDTRIARILTRSPGNYQGPELSPFRTYSSFLAATAVDLRILLAYREEDYTAVGDGWWGEPDQSDAARHTRNIHFSDAAPQSHLSIAPIASTFWTEGFVLAYQPSNTKKLETTLHYVMIAKDNLSMAFSDSSPYYGKADQPMALHNATYTISHYGSSRPSVEVMPANNNIGTGAFAVSQLRAGNLTYEAFAPQLQGSSSRDGLVIKPRPISRYARAQGYYCTYGDQPILNATAVNDQTSPLYDFIPWSPIVGVGSGGSSKIYMVRQPYDETKRAVLASFKHSSNQTPPELDLNVPLFSRPGGGLNDSSVYSQTSTVIASSTTETTTVLETAPENYEYTTPPTPLPKYLWPCDTDTYGMC